MSGRHTAETLLISAVLNSGDAFTAKQYGVTSAHFRGYREEYEWLLAHNETYAECPSPTQLKTKFPDFEYDQSQSDARWPAHEVKRSWASRDLLRRANLAITEISRGNVEDAYAHLEGVKLEVVSSRPDDAFRDPNFLDDYYDEEKDRIKLPWTTLQGLTNGIGPGELWYFAARQGNGKALTNTTMVATPEGWAKMGELTTGSRVIGSNGKPTKVIGVYPQGVKEVLEVAFNDGTVIEACEDHLWTVRPGAKKYRVATTKMIEEAMKASDTRYSVPTLSAPVQYQDPYRKDKTCFYDPYKLGLLLGDGCFRGTSVTFTTADPELAEAFGGEATKRAAKYTYGIRMMARTMKNLGLMGHTSLEKFIPPQYLTASAADRTALLQGLMDTDGHVSAQGQLLFYTSSAQLSQDVSELVTSLGGTVSVSTKETGHALSYRLCLSLPAGLVPFRLQRKVDRVVERTKYLPSRRIVSITRTGRYEEMTCIVVDALDSLFAVESMILTHNSSYLIDMGVEAALNGQRVCFYSMEMSKRQVQVRAQAAMAYRLGIKVSGHQMLHRTYDATAYKELLGQIGEQMESSGGTFDIHVPSMGRVSPGVVASLASEYDLHAVDYIGLMRTDDGRPVVRDWRDIAEVSNALKETALAKSTSILAASQVNREGDSPSPKPPALKNLAQSDHLGNDGDVVLTMKRYGMGAGIFSVEKNRHGPSLSTFFTKYDPDKGDFNEITQDAADDIKDETDARDYR